MLEQCSLQIPEPRAIVRVIQNDRPRLAFGRAHHAPEHLDVNCQRTAQRPGQNQHPYISHVKAASQGLNTQQPANRAIRLAELLHDLAAVVWLIVRRVCGDVDPGREKLPLQFLGVRDRRGEPDELLALAFLQILGDDIANHLQGALFCFLLRPLAGHYRDSGHVGRDAGIDVQRDKPPHLDQPIRARRVHHGVEILAEPRRHWRRRQADRVTVLLGQLLAHRAVQYVRLVHDDQVRLRPAPA